MEFELGKQFDGIRIISSQKSDGSMNFSVDNGANLAEFLSRNSVKKPLAFPSQSHKDIITFCDKKGRQIGADGVITDRNFVLAVKSADCLPLMIYNKKSSVIGAVHVSRHNLVLGIIDRLGDLFLEKGIDFASTAFFMGPHIRKESYPLSEEGAKSIFESPFKDFIGEQNRFDLTEAVKSTLEQRGAMRENIEDCKIDSFTSKEFYSSRADTSLSPNISVFATIIFMSDDQQRNQK